MSQPDSVALHQFPYRRLPRSMSASETWAFGIVNHLGWTSMVPTVHAALGTQAIFVWVPAVVVGMLVNYQVKHLGKNLVYVAGGTPNYITRLWQNHPVIARYAAIGYLLSWLSFVPLNAVVLTEIIQVNLEGLGITCPELILKISFTLLPFIVGFSGTRALSILHLFFVLPAFTLLLAFCVQGLGFLAFSPDSPGLFSSSWTSLSFIDWAKWFFFISYLAYSSETASSFVADSRHPHKTLKVLDVAAWLMLPIFVGGSWVTIRLVTDASVSDNAFLNFVVASTPFWGKFAPVITTFLLVSSCLLGSTTSVSNSPRIVYQLAVDKHLSPVFSLVSPRGVFGSQLTLCLLFCLMFLIWGDVSHLVVLGNVAWFVSFMILHLGLWLQRAKPGVFLPRLSGGIFMLEVVVLFVSAYAWGWQDFLIGLLAPLSVIVIDALVRYLPLAVFRSSWWIRLYQSQRQKPVKDSLALQVSILIFLLCGAVLVGCLFGWRLNTAPVTNRGNLVVVLLMIVAFVGVAIACWTSLPQVVALEEARAAAEHLFTIAQDGILVVDGQGVIRQANPATESFFSVNPSDLLGYHLTQWLPELANYPAQWLKRSEHTLLYNTKIRNLEVSVSDRQHQDFQEYVVIIHDITQRKQAEEILRQSEAQLRQEAQQLATQLVQSEKMSSLGQLVAGVAHEINNPVSFIYCNLTPANQYIQDLIRLLQLYQQHYPHPAAEITATSEDIDLNFLMADLPNLLTSMKVGAQRIKDIVLSLRNFSRLDEAEKKAVNIHEGIDSTLMILANRLKAAPNRPEIEVIKAYTDLPLVECYAGQLNQVFMNILANAIDALEESVIEKKTADHQQLVIAQPQIHIYTELTESQEVIIRIADNGSGVPNSIQEHLFEPFFTTKEVGQGTGLGLSISYQIITKKHGGKLKCISVPGKGTEFAIAIPLNQQKCQPK
ncbi:multi-sensor signal transduction histidine kinase [Cylindrospermum sp. NIES-4074]|nr:multi-sensor signal transduction histidine kinase [Cylindrospermum sp. NIES-4074]